MTQLLQVKQIGGSLTTVSVPLPNECAWERMVPVQTSLLGRGVQQGFYKVVMRWEVLGSTDFNTLMSVFDAAFVNGQRVEQVRLPPHKSNDNYDYIVYNGPPSQYIRMLEPKGNKIGLHVVNIEVSFEDVAD